MNKKELLELIKTGEGYTLEFKESLNSSISKSICAFANASGGKIILGIRDDDSIKGHTLTNSDSSKIQNITRNMDPSFHVRTEQVDNLVVIYVPEGKEKPYASGGHFYLRQGASSQQLNRNEIREFFQKENLVRFDRKANLDFDMDNDFDNKKFNSFIAKTGIDSSLPREHILQNLGLTIEGKINNTGVLFFSHRISKFFPNSAIACVLYSSKTKSKILDKNEFDADFVSNFNNAVIFALKTLKTEYIIKKVEREEKHEIPEEVLRELIINAMIHRDYFSEGRVLIEIYSDRVEISNPGRLLFKKDDLGKKSISRNPLFVDMVHRLKFVEKIGSGINRVKNILKGNIKFDIDEDWFRVIIKRKYSASGTVNGTVNGTVKLILSEMTSNPHITYGELASKTGKSRRTIIRQVEKLKEDGTVKRVGSDKTGHWEVR